MKKLGCAKCGGMKKMAKGGSTKSVSISKPGAGVVKETKGDTNQKMGIYGIAQTGPTGPNNSGIATMKKGGMVKKSLMKAQTGKVVKSKPIPNDVYKRDSTNYSNAANKYLSAKTTKDYNEGRDSLIAIKSRYGTPNELEKRMKRTVSGYDLKKKGGAVKSSMKKMQTGGRTTVKPTADSTAYYGDLEYKSKLKALTANTKPEMDKQFALMNNAKQDKYRQSKKGKPGYDKNGFPIKKK